ncbi:sigma-70 family RNA polymerase sigma factor [Paucibacter sp. PLA-PC-4]|uniref:RNA polymerase sigma factor n=1 Tax=Paucibacter sp. PLA-PC-4 TaxID=2993655 RepID=UPI0022497A9C|nr:sigma-70 family RNA polymerase sigma factor [Paucibacter sp. PLA-PC-4]MCX2863322.1 sigma-70 family RNA polymerase sigma factor [Paucibacter sp. PLA-PC-4]
MAALADWRAVLSRVRGTLRWRGCNGDDADDLIQDACVKLACYERTHEQLQADAFLLRALRNSAIDAHRVMRDCGQTLLLEDVQAQIPEPGLGASLSEDTVLDGERTPRMIALLASLPALMHKPFCGVSIRGIELPRDRIDPWAQGSRGAVACY